MAHSLYIGMTESGKTTLAKQHALEYRKAGINVLVCDPLNQRWDSATWQTDSILDFITVAKDPNTKNCALFLEESGQTIGKYPKDLQWLATQSRHNGHNTHFICQRCAQIDTTIRDQCTYFFIFRISFKDSKTLSDEFSSKKLLNSHELKKLEFYKSGRYCETEKFNLSFK